MKKSADAEPADKAQEKVSEEMETSMDEESAKDSVAADSVLAADALEGVSDLWTPVIEKLRAFDEGGDSNTADASLWKIFLLGLLGGLVALVTPCGWPIIPMTVSFFLKKGTTRKSTPEEKEAARKRGIRDAVLYGISIVVIYVTLGLVITALFGASALNDLATNAVFNIIFFLMLLVYAWHVIASN